MESSLDPFSLASYDYDLPQDRIAQVPTQIRDHSRLMVLDRHRGSIVHKMFAQLPGILRPDDLLVVNNTKVVRARLHGVKESGGKAEVLILDFQSGIQAVQAGKDFACQCLVKSSKQPKPGSKILFEKGYWALVTGTQNGFCDLRFSCATKHNVMLEEIGQIPLPPYIRRGENTPAPCDDAAAYQTLYAKTDGAVAAPTAGLHFTPQVMEALRQKGISIVEVTLHVGYGTFVPVREDDIRKHVMHAEWCSISEKAAQAVNEAKARGRRIVTVGTTSVRTMEHAAGPDGKITAQSGPCALFIHPGYSFKIVDAMITNFHLPCSTLLLLVSAFAGREKILAAYREAISQGYRFYSYGDAMLLE